MDETLRQLGGQIGGFLLGAIPTVILLLIVLTAYRFLVHQPLQRVLNERRSLTEGAIERARADIAAAEAKAAEYEQRLREARSVVFKAQEARRQQALQAHVEAIAQARSRAQEQVKQARAALEKEKESVQTSLQGEAERLAREIIAAILRPAATAPSPLAGGRS